ncbi:hypothetical protein [Chitinophaga nivalis]|uniref:DUF1360 domain-containing protein n=1 Tax=Chitinophaga nivalis TaxID=2991709 RepID=A0ABT3IIL2_9BACT|nr:hypothetical protein [Chitinophaga nivalis]MCW3466510.1 hypothetical protein [Chitinophaga nivalis]MCW3483799.1 hypothetical protein [Chitinophaga nivalis]
MLEAIGIGTLFVLGVYAAMGEEMILHWLKLFLEQLTNNRILKYLRPALYECPICMSSFWGTIAWLLMGFHFSELWVLYVIAVAGVNYLVVNAIS